MEESECRRGKAIYSLEAKDKGKLYYRNWDSCIMHPNLYHVIKYSIYVLFGLLPGSTWVEGVGKHACSSLFSNLYCSSI